MDKSKKKVTFRWWGDWTVLWILGGFVLTYFVFIPVEVHPEVHPLHWLFSVLGGVVGYGMGLFLDTELPPVVRFIRHRLRRTTLKQDREKQAKRRKW